MKPPLHLSLSLCILGLSCATARAQQVTVESLGQAPGQAPGPAYRDWTVFLHPALGYQLPVPPGVRALGDPENAVKTTFVSSDGSFVMSAWARLSPRSKASVLEAQWRAARSRPGRAIDYERRGRSWFVVSGTDDTGAEFYEKFVTSGDLVASYTLRYPRARLREFESWVEEIENGFRIVGPAVERSHSPFRFSFASNLRGARSSKPNRPSQALPEFSGSSTMARSEVKPVIGASRPEKPESDVTQPPTTSEPDLAVTGTLERPEPDASTIKDTAPQNRPETPASDEKELPIGERAPGKPGFVYSPYTSAVSLVDVAGIPAGTKARCPYTRKVFRVP